MNRTTFYRFFQDVYDLFDSVVKDYIRLLIPELTAKPAEAAESYHKSELTGYLSAVLAATEKNSAVYKKMLLNNDSSGIEEKLQSELFRILYGRKRNKTPNPDADQYMCGFVVFGLIGIWKKLVLDENWQSKEQFIEISSHQIDNYIRWNGI